MSSGARGHCYECVILKKSKSYHRMESMMVLL